MNQIIESKYESQIYFDQLHKYVIITLMSMSFTSQFKKEKLRP